jgi:hypothetical protein
VVLMARYPDIAWTSVREMLAARGRESAVSAPIRAVAA